MIYLKWRDKRKYKKQHINEDTILSQDRLVFGDEELWPAMKWKVPFGLSPQQLVAFCTWGLLFAACGILEGLWCAPLILAIWYLCAWRLSRIDWALMLTNGYWKGWTEEGYIESSGFIINHSNGRVYNRREAPFVMEYRRTHPGWWRVGKKTPKLPYADGKHGHYCDWSYTHKKEFWVTPDEYKAISDRSTELATKHWKYWLTDEGRETIRRLHKMPGMPNVRNGDYTSMAVMEFYLNHKEEIDNAKDI